MNKYIGLIKKISSRLEELTHYEKCSYDVLLEAQHYSITAGGKHLRGLILLETAKLGGAQAETVLDFACAMELVHTYSLIHDDLPEMDKGKRAIKIQALTNGYVFNADATKAQYQIQCQLIYYQKLGGI